MGERSDRASTAQTSMWRARPWPYSGGLALVCFAIQAITGIAMAFSYQPTPDHAYVSSYYISNVMPYGWLIRTVHAWGGELMIVFAAVHAIRVFWTGAYKRGREANWVIGVLAFLVLVTLGFTGHLLPWDQTAYWSTANAVALIRQAPLAGEWIAGLMLGSEALGATALTRFHAAHATLLPATLMVLLVAHLWVARRQFESDMASDIQADDIRVAPEATAGPADIEGQNAEGSLPQRRAEGCVPLYPDLLISAATSVVLLLCVFAVLAILVPVPLDVKADPTVRLMSAKPTWYFLSLYVLARYVPRPVAAIAPFALGLLLALTPFLDRGASRQPGKRPLALAIGCTVIGAIVGLTILGVAL